MPPARAAQRNNATFFSEVPLGTAGLDDALDYLSIDKGTALVKATPFVDWKALPAVAGAAGAAHVAAPRSEVLALVGPGSYVGTNAADLRAWRAAAPVTSRLTLAKINELAKKLDELTTFSTSTTDSQSYRKVLPGQASLQRRLL